MVSFVSTLQLYLNTDILDNSLLDRYANQCLKWGFLQTGNSGLRIKVRPTPTFWRIQLPTKTPWWASASQVKQLTIGLVGSFAAGEGLSFLFPNLNRRVICIVKFAFPILMGGCLIIGVFFKALALSSDFCRQRYQRARLYIGFMQQIKIAHERRVAMARITQNTWSNINHNVAKGLKETLSFDIYKQWQIKKGVKFERLKESIDYLNQTLLKREFTLFPSYAPRQLSEIYREPERFTHLSLQPSDMATELNQIDFFKKLLEVLNFTAYLETLCNFSAQELKKALKVENEPLKNEQLIQMNLPALLLDKRFIKYELVEFLQDLVLYVGNLSKYHLNTENLKSKAYQFKQLLLAAAHSEKNLVRGLQVRELLGK